MPSLPLLRPAIAAIALASAALAIPPDGTEPLGLCPLVRAADAVIGEVAGHGSSTHICRGHGALVQPDLDSDASSEPHPLGPIADASDWPLDPDPQTFRIRNARVWTDGAFVLRDLHVVGGVFVDDPVLTPDHDIDLDGRYVVPPMGDAHTHRCSGNDAPDARNVFVARGFAYLLNACSPPSARTDAAAVLDRPGGLDVVFSNGGFTSPGGHPYVIYRQIHTMYGGDPDTYPRGYDDRSYYQVDGAAQLDEKWRMHEKTDADFVKVMLLHGDQHQKRVDDPRYEGVRGLDPALVPDLVARAHARGIRIGAHVETRYDFRTFVEAGGDMVLHTPGYGVEPGDDPARYRLTAADARAAAEAGVIHVTTAALAAAGERADRSVAVMLHNVRTLKEAGVTMAFGSDDWRGPDAELAWLAEQDLFTPAEIVEMLCVTTPRAIFPDRRLGGFEPGDEANLLVLAGDPRRDLDHLLRPKFVVRSGALVQDGLGLTTPEAAIDTIRE